MSPTLSVAAAIFFMVPSFFNFLYSSNEHEMTKNIWDLLIFGVVQFSILLHPLDIIELFFKDSDYEYECEWSKVCE
jgi:hypothetical protein